MSAAVVLWLCMRSYGCVCDCSGVVVHVAAGLSCFSCTWMIAWSCHGSDPCCGCDMHQSFQASNANFPYSFGLNQRNLFVLFRFAIFIIFILMSKMLVSTIAPCLGGCTLPVGSASASTSSGAKQPIAAKPAVLWQ